MPEQERVGIVAAERAIRLVEDAEVTDPAEIEAAAEALWEAAVRIARDRCRFDADSKGCVTVGCSPCDARRSVLAVASVVTGVASSV